MGRQLGLPSLPSRDVVLYASAPDRKTRNTLRVLAVAVRSAVN